MSKPLGGNEADEYIYIVRHKMNILRARLLNLADSISENEAQQTGIKGLIKDFCNDAYYGQLESLKFFMEKAGVIAKDAPNVPQYQLDDNVYAD